MKILIYIISLLFSFIYSYFNYGISINFFVSSFLIILFSFLIIRKSKLVFRIKPILISIFLSFICISYIPNGFLFGYKNEQISIKINDSSEVKFSLFLNDEKQVISNHEDDLLTDYNITNKLIEKYYYTINSSSEYVFNSNYSKKITILFEKDNDIKSININDNYIEIPKRDSDDNSIFTTYNKVYYNYEYDNINNFNIYLFIISLIYMISMIYMIIINFDLKKIYLFLILLSIEYSGVINLSYFYKILLFSLLFILGLVLDTKFYKFQKRDILILLCSLFTTFCLTGQTILNELNYSIIFYFTIILIINFLLLYFFFHKFNININKKNKYNKKHKYIMFLILFVILLLIKYFIGDFYVHPDGTMQLKIFFENKNIDDWHPFMHTLFIQLFNNIFHSINGIIYVRIFFVSFLVATILDYFNKKGLKIWICYLIMLIFLINPVNIIYIMTLVKDVDFVICLVATTFLLMKFYDNKELFYKNKLNIVILSILLVLLIYFRHNGIYISIIISIVLLISLIRDKKIYCILVLIIIISSSIGLREYLRKKLDVYKTPENFMITTMLHGLDYLYINDELDDSDRLYLESIMDKGLWFVGYNKYNIDRLIFYNNGSLFYKDLDISKIMEVYMKNVPKHPILLTKDRLYGIDILWNVFGSDYIDTYKYHLIYDEYGNDWASSYNLKRNNNIVTNVLHNSLLFLGQNKITDVIFFRAGIYTLVSFIIIFYLIYIKKIKKILILLPCILNNITLLLAAHHQSYRYVMHMPYIIIMAIIYLLLTKKNETT